MRLSVNRQRLAGKPGYQIMSAQRAMMKDNWHNTQRKHVAATVLCSDAKEKQCKTT
jgi:hypothetical protein